jgi:rhamnosyltransferase subunit B
MRILFATIGSLGDLHPCLGLGLELKRRGHSVAIASTEMYRPKVLALGFEFHSLRPDWDPADSALIHRCEDIKTGPEVLIRELVLPYLEDTYIDLMQAARQCDFMLAGELLYAAPLVAEKLKLKWASIILSPCSFLSAYDPSLLVNVPHLIWLRGAGWRVNRALLNIGYRSIRNWWEPVKRLRAKEGLDPACEPLTRDKFSPVLVLALFAAVLAEPQPDWPKNTVQTGFAFYDGNAVEADLSRLADFLAAGEAPVVFTLGSTVVACPGNFYQASHDAILKLGKRALLVGARDLDVRSDQILAVPYIPYSKAFEQASVIVHQGGSGTTGQALRAGRPMLIIPFGWDQPDNALRMKRAGVGLSLSRENCSVDTLSVCLDRLLCETSFKTRAAQVAKQLKTQDGTRNACDAIESAMHR